MYKTAGVEHLENWIFIIHWMYINIQYSLMNVTSKDLKSLKILIYFKCSLKWPHKLTNLLGSGK